MADEDKRKQVAVRLGPKERERFQALADERASSVGAEVERLALERLAYLDRVDPETQRLFDTILERIERLQTLASKRKWHKSLTAWSAVSEMLAHVIDDARPGDPNDDEFVGPANERHVSAIIRRQDLVHKLGDLGFAVREDPKQPTLMGAFRGLLDPSAYDQTSSRTWEKAAIDALPGGEMKDKVQALFDELLAADEEVDAAKDEWAKAMTFFWGDEQKGRRMAVEEYPYGIAKQLAELQATAERFASTRRRRSLREEEE
jgi:hypothetical protein